MNFDALLFALKADEGLRLKPYLDTAIPPRLTIGYGCNLTKGITIQEAHDLLVGRAMRAQREAAALVPNWIGLNDARQNVLANMAFNLGGPGLAKFVKLLAAVNDRRWDDAAAEMKDSHWYTQVGSRAKRLTEEMLTGRA